jgi:hypothetical protein
MTSFPHFGHEASALKVSRLSMSRMMPESGLCEDVKIVKQESIKPGEILSASRGA